MLAYYVFNQPHRDYSEGVQTHANLPLVVSTVWGDYSHSGPDVPGLILVTGPSRAGVGCPRAPYRYL